MDVGWRSGGERRCWMEWGVRWMLGGVRFDRRSDVDFVGSSFWTVQRHGATSQ